LVFEGINLLRNLERTIFTSRFVKYLRIILIITDRYIKIRIRIICLTINFGIIFNIGASGGAVVEALRYKPKSRGIDSRWCHWNFSLT
jgi:hypothetical protein